ncbi:hypothetical protein EU528_06265 [Candidatus Thorarchaeota archaeon]|nr:MAG: hypothetical protein EU528_06265 [Candidatus Thorarchaeota archaeon]
MKNRNPVILCLVGGFLLFQASWIGSIGFIDDIAAYAIAYFPAIADILTLVLNALTYIAGLGGIAVMIGAILIAMSRIGIGKFVIGLGAGIGLIGLIIMLAEAVIAGGVEALLDIVTLISQSIAWIGVILSILGRRTISKE